MSLNPTKRLSRITGLVIALFVVMSSITPMSTIYGSEQDSFKYETRKSNEETTGYTGTSIDILTPDSAFEFELNSDKDSYYIKNFVGSQTDIIIPTEYKGKPVTVIGDSSFQGNEIKSVVIPETITLVDDFAFSYNYELKKIEFKSENLIPEFGNMAFDMVENAVFICHISLQSDLSKRIEWNLNYLSCTIETFGTMPPDPEPEPDPEITPDEAFTFTENADKDGYIVSKYIGTKYKKIGIPSEYNGKPVTEIGKEAFSPNRNIESVTISESVTIIGGSAFYNCQAIKEIKMPSTLMKIGQQAFQRCNSLTEINIPVSVDEIGWDAFAFCKILKNINVHEDNEVFKDIEGVLYSKDGTTLIYYSSAGRTAQHYEVPDGTKAIQEDAFKMHYEDSSESKLKTVGYPSTLKSIGARAFKQTNLEEITVYGEIEMGNYVYDLCKNLKIINVAEGVRVLPKGIFYGVDYMEKMNLPSTLEVIEDEALERYPLSSIDLPEGLKKIGKDAFANSKITSLTIPASVEEIDMRSFYYMNSLTSAAFAPGSQIEELAPYSFCQNKSLESLTLPDSLKVISTGAISSCYSLESIKLPENLEILGDAAFKSCTSLSTIDFNPTLKTLGNEVFSGTGLINVSMPSSITEIGNGTFSECSKLVYVYLRPNLEKWGTDTFKYCTALKNVYFPSNIKINNIPSGTFVDCLKLDKLELPAVIDQTGNTAFLNNVNLIIEYKSPELKRHPLDCSNLIISNDSYYELKEDGNYYTTRDLYVGETLLPADSLINTQKNVTFRYVGDETIFPAIESVKVTEGIELDEDNKNAAVKVDILASGIKAGKNVNIKVVGRDSGETVTDAGILALAKGENIGKFASIKTFNLNFDELSKDIYDVFVSLDNKNWTKAENTITVTTNIMHTITSSATEGGNITETTDYKQGSTASVTYTPNEGYQVAALYVDDQEVDYNKIGGTYEFTNITSSHTVRVVFEKIETPKPEPKNFNVISIASTGGKITPTGTYKEGSDVAYTYTPDKGYKVEALYVNGELVEFDSKGGTYVFKNIGSENHIVVFFSESGVVLGEKAAPKASAPKLFKAKAQKKKAKLTWEKSKGVAKYQIAYKLKNKKKWSYKTVSAKKKALVIKKLSGKKKYQFKIRSYKSTKNNKVYSKWSKIKTIKVK